MSQNSRNVPISSLLSLSNDDDDNSQDTNNNNNSTTNSNVPSGNATGPLKNIVSQFQTAIDITSPSSNESSPVKSTTKSRPRSHHEIMNLDSSDDNSDTSIKSIPGLGPPPRARPKKPAVIKQTSNKLPLLIPKPSPQTSISPSPNPQPSIQVPKGNESGPFTINLDILKQFQPNFNLSASPPLQSVSKTSINSIINIDDDDPSPPPPPSKPQEPVKRKRGPRKKDGEAGTSTSKKRKTAAEKSTTPATGTPTEPGANNKPTSATSNTTGEVKKRKPASKSKASDGSDNTAPTERKKPGPKPRKKTPENGALSVGTSGNSNTNTANSSSSGSVPKNQGKDAATKGSTQATATKSAEPTIPKQIVHPTMATDKAPSPKDKKVNLPKPKFDVLEDGDVKITDVVESENTTGQGMVNDEKEKVEDEKEKDKEKEKEEKEKEREREKEKEREKQHQKDKEKPIEKPEPPIISLNIPLLDPKDPKPGQSEVIINVLKLAEDTYGWSAIHPNAKSAIDLMDELIDEDEDLVEEEEDDDLQIEDQSGQEKSAGGAVGAKPQTSRKKEDEELTEEQLVRQHEVKMNRKVGKYDYEDPFIDDEELQLEEEISSTKEGFFVYWGPLVDDRNLNNANANKKGSSKAKR